MNRTIIVACLALFLIAGAQAATLTGGFSLETDCSTPAKATYVLHNDSGATQSYSIRATGANKGWINVNGVWIGEKALEARLESGESMELYAFVKPQSCYVQPGKYFITIEAGNETREISVVVEESRSLEISLSPGSRAIAQCGSAEFEARIKNTGSTDEIVVLGIDGIPPEWTRIGFTELFIAKGETKKIKVELRPACNAQAGDHEFSIRAAIKGTGFSAGKKAFFSIEDRQGIEITAGQLVACTERAMEGGKATVKNTGLLEDRVSLETKGISWARVEPSSLVLAPGEEKQVSIMFEKASAAEGGQELILRAHSEKFGKDAEKRLLVEAKECYKVSITGEKINGVAIEGGKASACIGTSPVYSFGIKNGAIEAITAEITVLGIDAIVLPAGPLSIASGKTGEASVEISLAKNQPGTRKFTIGVKGENFSASKEVELEAENCYELAVEWDGLEKEIALDANCKSAPFTISVFNRGTRSQKVSVSVQGPKWAYFEPVQLGIGPGESQEVYFYFAPPYDTVEGLHHAIVSVRGKGILLEKDVNMAVYGGLYAGLGNASIRAEAGAPELAEKTERTVKATVRLSNDGNSAIRLFGVSSEDLNATFTLDETMLQPAETIAVPMTLIMMVGESTARQFQLMLAISTDKGTIEREITVDLDKKEGPAVVGLFGIGNPAAGDLLLAAVVIAVIAVFAVIALKSGSYQGKESGVTLLAREVQGIPGKKLEEIGKHRKTGEGTTHSGLQEIVDRVRKKHVEKKAAPKGKKKGKKR